MRLLRLRRLVKKAIIRSGFAPLRRLEIISALLRLGRWLRESKCRIILDSRDELFRYVNNKVLRNEPVDYLEFGVFEGKSIRVWAELNGNPGSRFIGFDSFEGLPADWEFFLGKWPKGHFTTGGKVPEIDDERVEFVRGYFHDVLADFLRTFERRNRLVVHLDADLYASTLFVLATLDPIIAPGDLLIFDDFPMAAVDDFRAFTDYTTSFIRKCTLLAMTDIKDGQVAIQIDE